MFDKGAVKRLKRALNNYTKYDFIYTTPLSDNDEIILLLANGGANHKDVLLPLSDLSVYIRSGISSPLTTKGDLYAYDTDDTRLAAGTDGYVLMANSLELVGFEWTNPNDFPIDGGTW